MAVNGDLTLGLSLGMDTAALLVTGALGGKRPHPARILLGAGVGTLPTLVALLSPWRGLGLFDLALTPWAMVGIAFSPAGRREWITLTATLYAVTVGLGGASLAAVGLGLPLVPALLLGAAGGAGLAGWWRQTVTRPLRDRRGRTRVRLTVGGESLVLEGLFDSGNQLYTPTGLPVVVVAADAMRPWLRPKDRPAWAEGGRAAPAAEARLGTVHATTVAGRLSLSVLRVNKAEVEVNGEWQALRPLVVGLSDRWPGPSRGIAALVNPDWILEPASR